jgi:P27 family predicted phage terminase small subunit
MRQRGRKSAANLSTPALQLVAPLHPVQLPPAPNHLSAATKRWWAAIVADYEMGEHHLKLLESAADAWDRMVAARTALLKDGITVAGKDGPKQHPAYAIERDSRASFAKLIRELDLDGAAPPEARRPPAIWSNRRP